ncbi:MAG: hypothetical protein SGJ19_07735 [Planctomycetia bacterium]|nr:hypothetical protein [Planctomycetia bacterium]
MKPRFSILTLLGVTAYVAINAAAFQSLAVCAVARWLWWGLMFLVLIVATGRTSGRTVFARGLLLSVLFAFTAITYHNAHLWPLLNWLENLTNTLAGTSADEDVYFLVITNATLAFGLVGGALSLWRYRVLERREKEGAE